MLWSMAFGGAVGLSTGPPSAVLETATPLFVARTGWLAYEDMPHISKYSAFLNVQLLFILYTRTEAS